MPVTPPPIHDRCQAIPNYTLRISPHRLVASSQSSKLILPKNDNILTSFNIDSTKRFAQSSVPVIGNCNQ
ncbi:hypothetical protein V1478_009784 [Vespula squamosa]|uniref:Uncharacterized protein n=1 Tax=Vespula squamosa TaxID=30214 RepID=A0ABD2AJD1_VESSQ